LQIFQDKAATKMNTNQQQGQNASVTPSTQVIDPATELGLVALAVSDLARSIAFYTDAIGLALFRQEGATAVLGAGEAPLLILTEEPGARPWPRCGRSYTGLYHFALLLPTRADLGRWVRHWITLGLPLGQGDHLVSEALYLEDPDGNGIEVYRDRPRSEWRWLSGQVQMATDPVDIQGLLAEADRAGEPWSGLPAGARLGHIHLQIGDITQGATFYHQVLGFDIVAQMPSALFVSAGGYHHHIGMNIWHSKGAGPAPVGTVGLRYFTVTLPSEEARQAVLARVAAAGLSYTQTEAGTAVLDPWQNTILFQVNETDNDQAAIDLATMPNRAEAQAH
jgi:catechol 2,3-dioxygenase